MGGGRAPLTPVLRNAERPLGDEKIETTTNYNHNGDTVLRDMIEYSNQPKSVYLNYENVIKKKKTKKI